MDGALNLQIDNGCGDFQLRAWRRSREPNQLLGWEDDTRMFEAEEKVITFRISGITATESIYLHGKHVYIIHNCTTYLADPTAVDNHNKGRGFHM